MFARTAQVYGEFAGVSEHRARGDSGTAARFFYCAKATREDRNDGLDSGPVPAASARATMRDRETADWSARNGNHHPTVKPTNLMRYLCRLVTPAGGLVLDPFMGSGSTGKAAVLEGFQFVGIELDPTYAAIAEARIRVAQPGLPLGAIA
ncbi:DNA methyltransferase [Stenotrophomonas maltophilia group sp. LNF259]